MNATGRHTVQRRLAAAIAAIVLCAATLAGPPRANAAFNAICDNLQLPGDNSFASRDQNVPAGPWVVWSQVTISYYNYTLCQDAGIPFIRPEQSSSGAWIAVEGPYSGGPLGNTSIVQVGYIKCQNSTGCAVSGIDSSHWNRVVYFYAFGNSGDIFHLPSPQYIADATSGDHVFKVFLTTSVTERGVGNS